jgi:threonine synthase
MGNFTGYRCSLCGREYGKDEVTYTCPEDGGNLDVVLDFAEVRRLKDVRSGEASMWAYLPLLPVSDPGYMDTPFRNAGGTPVYKLGGIPGFPSAAGQLWVKDESVNPTASFKDRASALVLARAMEIGGPTVVTASTGNAGAALAGMAAASGQKAVIFAPKKAPPAKLAQAKVFGARLILVDGNYDSAGRLALEAAEEFGWYCRNTGYNPFTIEGKKTAAFEIWDLIRRGGLPHSPKRPLSLFVPVGDGNIISGIHKGCKDLAEAGLLEVPPRIFGVQSEGSAAIARAWASGTEEVRAVSSDTIADSISVDMPADGVRALRAVRETGGAYIEVTDTQIIEALSAAGKAGIFSEPAGAAAFAGYGKALETELIGGTDAVLVLNTGSGLKDAAAVQKIAADEIIIEPDLRALKKALGK